MITPDRWQQIKEIFQSAQEKTPAERLDFLNHICGDDHALREEVEGLLTADESNGDFLSAPAFEFAAGMLADEKYEASEFSAGQKVDRYTILCPLGAGGMGEIYLAQDEQLGRKIALKLIARQFATDPRRVSRFEQEARAASALNHPNVCVIHETGVTDNNRHFITMEYIQGITLRDKLLREPISLLEAVQIATQVAAALAAAHAAGIVHRDIKPENIMLRPDGWVKVLDFGLAKLTEIIAEPLGVHEVSTSVRTEAGTLMGTVKYMSPEQLHEEELDERTDIWSLGVVLYEMLTGTTPFESRTPNGTINLICGPQPPALSLPDQLPARFREIVIKALQKDRVCRYQTITKLASDLNALQRELEREADIALTSQRIRLPLSWHLPLSSERTQMADSGSALMRIKSQAIQTAEFLFTEIRSHKRATLFAVTMLVLASLLFLPDAVRRFRYVSPKPTRMMALTNSGNSVCAAISKDGKLVAHVEEQDAKQRLILTSIVSNASYTLVPPDELQYLGVTFSPDNLNVYFTREEKGAPPGLYRVLVSEGAPVKVKDGVEGPITFSPQGDQYAFVRLDRQTTEFKLVVSDLTYGGNERVIATRSNGERLSTYGLSWSPDGNVILCPTTSWSPSYHMDLVAFDLINESSHTIGKQSWFSVYQVAWSDDMSSLVVSARIRETSQHQLWRISYPAGDVQPIASDLNEYLGVTLSGDTIVTVRTDRTWSLWIETAAEPARAKAIVDGVGMPHGVTWTATGRIVFSAMSRDRLNILRVNPDGSDTVQLTKVGDNYNPAASGDGRSIAFSSNRDGHFNIWRMNTEDGSAAKQLTFSDGNFYPTVSPDNQWVAYDNQYDWPLSVWKVRFEGGTSVKIGDRYRMPAFSPDNQFIAARYDRNSDTNDLAIYSANGGEPVRKLAIPNIEWQRPRYIDKHTLSYVKRVDGYSNIWSLDLRTGAEKQLTHLDADQIYSYAWSPDFTQIASQRGKRIRDVVMITSER